MVYQNSPGFATPYLATPMVAVIPGRHPDYPKQAAGLDTESANPGGATRLKHRRSADSAPPAPARARWLPSASLARPAHSRAETSTTDHPRPSGQAVCS